MFMREGGFASTEPMKAVEFSALRSPALVDLANLTIALILERRPFPKSNAE